MEEWPTLVVEKGEKPFRAGQLAEWIFKKRVSEFKKMSNLPGPFRSKMETGYHIRSLELDHAVTSQEDGTTRYFFNTKDDKKVSCVYLPFEERRSLCVSTQVGCAWGCVFCASGKVPYERNLTPTEILDQIMIVEDASGQPLDSILFMGMGEPLANYRNLVMALQLIRSPLALHFGARHVTVSTCGLVPQIEMLAKEAPKVNLAISLHASNDELRKKLLPKSSKWTIRELMTAAKFYSMQTKSRVTFEYIVLQGVNDSDQDAKRLANLVRGPAEHGDYWVNLIAYNPVPGLSYKRPTEERIETFKEILTARRVPVRLRKPQGVDIGAGCGQLGEAR
ncbi:MAG: putative dual-specificity RNA methyltransferase RlmN [Elusimicrobia bacterium]|nr:putative dual-specificity RNA methyltransferase RlmN [Elusimicrobiota bacterium]